MISRKRAVAFGERSLTDVVASEIFNSLRGRERGKSLTAVNLSGGRDWFDARGATDVRPRITWLLSHRIDARINRPGVQRNPQAKTGIH